MGRYVRDEILLQALEMAHCPTVTKIDAPGGIIQPGAMSVKWLQNAVDYFHRVYPFSSDITEISMTAIPGQEDLVVTNDTSLYKPRDFVLDVKDGITGLNNNAPYIVYRRDYQRFRRAKLNTLSQSHRYPSNYCMVNNRIKITPKVTNTIILNLEYYRLDEIMEPTSEVNFPDEWVLIQYIQIKAREWTRDYEPGTADTYLAKKVATLRSSGLLNQPEYEDGVPLESDSNNLATAYYNRNVWMGNPNG